MNSLTQPYLSPVPAHSETRLRYGSAARTGAKSRGLKKAARPQRTASPEFGVRQPFAFTVPTSTVDRKRGGLLGGSFHTAVSARAAQDAVDISLASAETDAPRPRGIFEAFVKTCRRWRLDHDRQAALLGHPPPSTLGVYVLTGFVLSPSVDAHERATRVFEISLGLGTLFDEDPEVENEWLRTPRARFGNASPLDHMLEGPMENLLAVAELVRHERGL